MFGPAMKGAACVLPDQHHGLQAGPADHLRHISLPKVSLSWLLRIPDPCSQRKATVPVQFCSINKLFRRNWRKTARSKGGTSQVSCLPTSSQEAPGASSRYEALRLLQCWTAHLHSKVPPMFLRSRPVYPSVLAHSADVLAAFVQTSDSFAHGGTCIRSLQALSASLSAHGVQQGELLVR